MTLSRGRDILAIPGPSIIPDRVLRAMHRPAPNIYEGELVEMTETVIADLAPGGAHRRARSRSTSATAMPAGRRRSPTSSRPARRRWSIATGRFGLGWAETARQMGVEVEVMDFGFRGRDRPRAGRRRGCAPTASHAIRAVLAVQTDTASSVQERHRGAARRARRRRASGAPRRRLHRLPRLRPLRDGRLGRRRDGRRLPEGADDAAGPRLHLPRAARPRRRGCRCPSPYWDWGPRTAPRSTTSSSAAPRRRTTSTGCAAPRHDPAEEGLEAVWTRHASSPARSGRRSRPGAQAARSRSTSPTRRSAATR